MVLWSSVNNFSRTDVILLAPYDNKSVNNTDRHLGVEDPDCNNDNIWVGQESVHDCGDITEPVRFDRVPGWPHSGP